MKIERQYIVNEQNHKTAVLLDIKTFEKMEDIFENYALYHLMNESSQDDKILDLEDAKKYYNTLLENP
jgi:hypothetical protein